MIGGLSTRATTVPTYMPLKFRDRARARSCVGIQREVRLWIAGKLTPSPKPSRLRAAKSRARELRAAAGVMKVASDQTATPKASTRLPPNLSASQPPASWGHRYPQKNAERISPCAATL